jgi:hypothetical protein
MKTAGSWNIGSIVGKIMVGLVLTTMIGAIGVLPAHSKDNERRIEKHDNDRYEKRGRGNGRGRYNQGRRNFRPPVYQERMYAPPPVIYAPPRPPGISIFLPPLTFRP